MYPPCASDFGCPAVVGLLGCGVLFGPAGLQVAQSVFYRTVVTHFWLIASIVGGLIVGKFVAACAAGYAFGYSPVQANLMWSLSLPQVAATLAAALVAYQAKNAQGQ